MEISERIKELIALAKEEGSGIDRVSMSSFLFFIEVMRGNVKDRLSISLTPENEIYATWQGAKKHCISFKRDGDIKFFSL